MKTVAKEFDAGAPVGLFAGVCESSLAHFFRSSPIEIIPDDTIVISEGVRLRHLHIVRNGAIELFVEAGLSGNGYRTWRQRPSNGIYKS